MNTLKSLSNLRSHGLKMKYNESIKKADVLLLKALAGLQIVPGAINQG